MPRHLGGVAVMAAEGFLMFFGTPTLIVQALQ